MSVFEYLGVLLSVVMGLGMTHVLIGISKMIHHRDTVRTYWVHLWWAVNVLVYVIAIWWGMFWWSSLSEWSFFQFLFVIVYAIALFLLASLLFPWDMPEDFDAESHFYAHRRWFFGILVIAWCVDIPETVFKAEVGLRALPTAYLGWVAVHLLLAATAAWTDSKRFHASYAVFWLVWLLGFLSLSTLNLIAS